jgi:uncharacterized damage-inducible protein DinB
MSIDVSAALAYRIRRTHEWALTAVADLSPEQVRRGSAGAPSIGFHLWHMARWADLLQAKLPEMTEELATRLSARLQIWESEALAARWGLTIEQLGGEATGMGMDDDVSATLALPGPEELAGYTRRAFGAVDEALAAVDDGQLAESCVDMYGARTSVGTALLSHVSHMNRHLGMIEALKGAQGLRGTATA